MTSGLRLPSRSLNTPENIFTNAVAASDMPSINPTVITDAPRTVVMKIGNRLWIISEEMSMNSEPTPNAQTLDGRARHTAGADFVSRWVNYLASFAGN